MKHTIWVTVILVAIFFASQVVGLAITKAYVDVEKTQETGNLTWKPLLQLGETEVISRPQVKEESSAFIYVLSAIIIGTILALFLIRLRRVIIWKIWFFVAVAVCLSIAFNAFIPTIAAIILGVGLALYKIIRPAVIIHNITEIFIYGGLVAIFVPIFNVFWAIMLLLAISAYDAYAVWKSKHMIELAKEQSKAKVFAGLLIPYTLPKKIKGVSKAKLRLTKVRTAILGGGDVGFPLLFAAVVMKETSFLNGLIVAVFVSIALFILLIKGKKDKFYPAMPFLTAGCLIGYLITVLI
jgi:presenilin-like A22 family membrane protease